MMPPVAMPGMQGMQPQGQPLPLVQPGAFPMQVGTAPWRPEQPQPGMAPGQPGFQGPPSYIPPPQMLGPPQQQASFVPLPMPNQLPSYVPAQEAVSYAAPPPLAQPLAQTPSYVPAQL